jgi:hypothetical protein
VPIDFHTDDLEVLIAACVVWKGSCCYHAHSPGGNPPRVKRDMN